MLRRGSVPEQGQVTVMQAMTALSDSTMGYDMHNWGQEKNAPAIAKWEAWMREHPAGK